MKSIIDKTTDAVCSAFGVERTTLLHSRSRQRRLTDARMALCLLLTEQGISRHTIANTVGRTRPNIIYSLRHIVEYATYDKQLATKIESARRLATFVENGATNNNLKSEFLR